MYQLSISLRMALKSLKLSRVVKPLRDPHRMRGSGSSANAPLYWSSPCPSSFFSRRIVPFRGASSCSSASSSGIARPRHAGPRLAEGDASRTMPSLSGSGSPVIARGRLFAGVASGGSFVPGAIAARAAAALKLEKEPRFFVTPAGSRGVIVLVETKKIALQFFFSLQFFFLASNVGIWCNFFYL